MPFPKYIGNKNAVRLIRDVGVEKGDIWLGILQYTIKQNPSGIF